MPNHEGGCQCGAIRYRIAAHPLTLYNCHCTDCQKQSSSAFGMSMMVPQGAVAFTKGKPAEFQATAQSGRPKTCLFCPDCGSRLFHKPTHDAGTMNLKPGTLDDRSWLNPIGNLWTGSAQPWVTIDPNGINYEGQPENFDTLIESYQAIKAEP